MGRDRDSVDRVLEVLKLPQSCRELLEELLGRQFSRAVAGPSGSAAEAETLAVLWAAGVAQELGETELCRQITDLGVTVSALPCSSLFQKDFKAADFPSNQPPIALCPPSSVSLHCPLRVRCLQLDTHWSLTRHTHEPTTDHYLSLYILRKGSQGVVLLPRKYSLASKLQQRSVQSKALVEAVRQVYVRTRDRSPPVVSRELHASFRDTTLALRRARNAEFAALNWISKGLKWALRNGKAKEVAILRQELDNLAGKLGETARNQLQWLTSELDADHPCDLCHSAAPEKLPCSHFLCSACLSSVLLPGTLSLKGLLSTLSCPLCRVTIPPSALSTAISAHLETLAQHSGLRYCSLCEHLHTLAAFSAPSCGHLVCSYCICRRKEKIECEICRATEPFGQCGRCSKPLDYQNAAELTCTATVDGQEVAKHAELCGKCSNACYGHEKCCEERPLTALEREIIGREVLVRPECCNGDFRHPNELVAAHCDHAICPDCTSDRCGVCGEAIPEKEVRRLAACGVCKRKEGEILLNCGHFLHKGCLQDLISRNSSDNCAHCPICSRYISPTSVLTQLSFSPDLISAFDGPFGYSLTSRCPQGCPYFGMYVELGAVVQWCTAHSLSFCVLCGLQDPADSHMCAPFEQRRAVDSLLEQGKKAGQCPQCLAAQEVHLDQDYQGCACGCYFTPCCCAFYEPIWYHGGAWHRPNCPKYSHTPGNGGCPHCQGQPTVCPQPKALKRHRLITAFEQGS